MNKNGFIATSLLYSFFLLFCALILAFVSNIGHNTILINKEIDKINEDIHSNKKIMDVDIGTYFRLNICVSDDKKDFFNSADTMDYILFSKDESKGKFVSKNYSYKLNSLELLDEILNSVYIKNYNVKVISKSMSLSDYNIVSEINNVDLKKDILVSDFDKNTKYLLLVRENNEYSTSKVYDLKTQVVRDINSTDISSDNTFVRLVFQFNSLTKVIGGDGTLANPYLLEGGASKCE